MKNFISYISRPHKLYFQNSEPLPFAKSILDVYSHNFCRLTPLLTCFVIFLFIAIGGLYIASITSVTQEIITTVSIILFAYTLFLYFGVYCSYEQEETRRWISNFEQKVIYDSAFSQSFFSSLHFSKLPSSSQSLILSAIKKNKFSYKHMFLIYSHLQESHLKKVAQSVELLVPKQTTEPLQHQDNTPKHFSVNFFEDKSTK
jgi:hypothetical protein